MDSGSSTKSDHPEPAIAGDQPVKLQQEQAQPVFEKAPPESESEPDPEEDEFDSETDEDDASLPSTGGVSSFPSDASTLQTFPPTSSGHVPVDTTHNPNPGALNGILSAGGGSAGDDPRRLFQRLWSDEEEILILKDFLDFTARRGTTFASHQYDTGPFYEEIRRKLSFEFTKSQLIEKLRRLKKKYRQCALRMASASSTGKDFAFKSTHEQAIYNIAKNIWQVGVKRDRDSDDNDSNPGDGTTTAAADDAPVLQQRRRVRRRKGVEDSGDVEMMTPVPPLETVPVLGQPQVGSSDEGVNDDALRNCLSPLFKELIGTVVGVGVPTLGDIFGTSKQMSLLSPLPPFLKSCEALEDDERWKQQQISELEVYLKRLELLRDQVAASLQALKAAGS